MTKIFRLGHDQNRSLPELGSVTRIIDPQHYKQFSFCCEIFQKSSETLLKRRLYLSGLSS
jgi:hypothetical protein